jgi:hypothetical protein
MKLYSILFEQQESQPQHPFSPELFDALKELVAKNKIEKLEALMPEIKELISSGKYSDLTDPSDAKVYRGMKISFERAEELCKTYECIEETTDKKGVVYKIFKGSVVVPTKRTIQSWSGNVNVGIQFAMDPEIGGEVPIVFSAIATKDKFFGKPGEFGRIAFPKRASEMETISISEVTSDGFALGIPPDVLGRNPSLVNPNILKALVLKL